MTTSAMADRRDRRQPVRYFVVYCEEDDSHTTLDEGDVICEPSVKVGDRVSFFCDRKSPWEGIVKAIGDDMVEMCKIRDELNSCKPNRDGSFQAGRKRRTAERARSALRDLCARRTLNPKKKNSDKTECLKSGAGKKMTSAEGQYLQKLLDSRINYSDSDSDQRGTSDLEKGDNPMKTTNSDSNKRQRRSSDDSVRPVIESDDEIEDSGNEQEGKLKDKGKGNTVLGKLLSSSDDSGSENNDINENDDKDDSASSSSEEPLSPEEIAALEKIARKRKCAEINQLIALSKEKSPDPGLVSKRSAANGPPTSKVTEGMAGKEDHLTTEQKSITSKVSTQSKKGNVSNSEGNKSHGQVPDPTKVTNKSNGGSSNPAVKRGRYTPRYTKKVFSGEYFNCKASDPDVERLWPKYEVYIQSKDLTEIKKKACSGKEVGRLLVSKVFTQQAIEECSVTGRPASGRGRDNATLRPPLSEDGVKAICEFAKARAMKKKWKEVTDTEVKKSMSNVLVETRYYEKLAEQQAQDEQLNGQQE